MKKIIGIMGVSLFIGAVAYLLWSKTQMIQSSIIADTQNNPTDDPVKNNPPVSQNTYTETDELADTKVSVVDTISTRHEEAEQVMKAAIEVICKNSEVTDDINHELEQMSIELENLLSED